MLFQWVTLLQVRSSKVVASCDNKSVFRWFMISSCNTATCTNFFLLCLSLWNCSYKQELEARFSYLPGNVVWQAHELISCCVPCFEAFSCSYTQSERICIDKRISNRPHVILWPFKTCVVSWHVCQSDLGYAIFEAWQCFQQSLAVVRTHGVFKKEDFENKIYVCKLVCALRMHTGTLAFYWFRSAVIFGIGWLIQQQYFTLCMWWKQILPWGILVLLVDRLDRWRMLLVICRMALYTEVTYYSAGSWIFLICA